MRNITIRSGGMELAVRAAGDSRKPALVLLHGWRHSGQLFDPAIDKLGEDGFVLAFDLPGIGGSRGAPPSAEKHVLADVLRLA